MKTSCDFNIDKVGETPSVTSLVLKNCQERTTCFGLYGHHQALPPFLKC